MAQVIKYNENTFVFDEGGVRFFLLTGTEKALMVDCGMQTQDALEQAKQVTDMPIELVITHADRDHIASIEQFDTFFMHPSEASNFYNTRGRTGVFMPVEEGFVFDLGGREIKVIATPGHTPGSIALLDEDARFIITGDPIQDGNVFMFGVQREMHAYLHSLLKVKKLSDKFDDILPSHGSLPVKADIIDGLYAGAVRVLEGKVQGQEMEMHGNKIVRYDVGCAGFLMGK